LPERSTTAGRARPTARSPRPHSTDLSEIDDSPLVDEPSVDEDTTEPAAAAPLEPLPLGELPGGPRFGSLVHEILELTDFAAHDLDGDLAREAMRAGAPALLLQGDADPLVRGLATALSTPLGPLFDDRPLRSFGRVDRLDELSFDLPLAGGDRPVGAVTMAAIADVFAQVPAGDPLAGYHERLRDPILSTEVRGFLTGSIDLVARVGGTAGRHVVVDYKTNRLAPSTTPLTAEHYRPESLALAMQDAHYPLQAMLYAVALHRFLRWRLPGYAPDEHLGGIAYLFLRGMTGEDAGGAGVFSWRPPGSMVVALSDVLDRGAA
jgi:exodeoxyribonuclease V beta subunit